MPKPTTRNSQFEPRDAFMVAIQHTCSGSTCCRPERVKISRPPEGRKPRRAQRDSPEALAVAQAQRRGRMWRGWPYRPVDKPLQWTVTYRGGSNGWVEVRARGTAGYFHCCTSLMDVMNVIAGGR